MALLSEHTECRRVVVIGQGYVGLPLAIRAAEVGHKVLGYDTDTTRVAQLRNGVSYVEDVPGALVQRYSACGKYTASAEPRSCAGFDIAVITVPTPLKEGTPDLSYIEESAAMLARFVRPGCCVVLESTTYPGTTEELVQPILEHGSGLVAGEDFFLGYSPERIDPGNVSWGFQNTPKVVSGINDPSRRAVDEFYRSLVDRTVPVTSTAVAEATKLLENTFRHVNIALVNELAMFAADLGIDVWEAIDAASTKPFGFMRFTPGPGVGGHCLPIDPSYLSWRVKRSLGQNFRFVELANDVNEHMPEYVVRRIMEGLNARRLPLNGASILLLGLAYKKNTGDARESPSIPVAERLIALGATVQAADPHVSQFALDGLVERVDATPERAGAVDAVVLLTDHDVFDLDALAAAAKYLFDARRRVKGMNVEYL